jgi:hypothetical protein
MSEPTRPTWKSDELARIGGVDKDVLLVETDDVSDEIDGAYRTKYQRYAASTIDAITSPEARAATLKLVPRATAS